MQQTIDLRSDTVSQPTDEMRSAMAQAPVGDDVFGEDPTVNRLQELTAEMLGKEAGLFVPSGTMGNLIAVLVHCQRGDEAIMGDLSHTFLFEAGGVSALGSVFPHTLPNQPDGTLKLNDIRGAFRSSDIHNPISRLLILENTHNRCGGVVLSADYTRQAGALAREIGIKFHMDGARLFNAAVATGCTPAELAGPADSVTVCLSKALCAPVGSLLCGSAQFVQQARRIRKQLGGGMRQAGILAAAGIVALEKMVAGLSEDHRRAQMLAAGITQMNGVHLSFGLPETNMVFASLDSGVQLSAAAVAGRMAKQGIKIGVVGPGRFRMVTHHWVDDSDVERTLAEFQQALI